MLVLNGTAEWRECLSGDDIAICHVRHLVSYLAYGLDLDIKNPIDTEASASSMIIRACGARKSKICPKTFRNRSPLEGGVAVWLNFPLLCASLSFLQPFNLC